jgi:hypothetical protein
MKGTGFNRFLDRIHGEGGQAALFAVFILLMFLSYWVVIVMATAGGTSSVLYGLRAKEALYAAETGIEYAIEEIKACKVNAGNIQDLDVDGTIVDVINTNDTLLTAIASTSDPAITRTIQLRIEVPAIPAAFFYALYVANDELLLDRNVLLEGDILYDGPDLQMINQFTVQNTTIYVPRTATIYTENPLTYTRHDYMYEDEPPDDFPTIETSYYDAYINNDYGYVTIGNRIQNPTYCSDYPDNVIYRHGNLNVNSDVIGPGILVASNQMMIMNGAVIGPDVRIIAGGNLSVMQGTVTTVQSPGSLIYSATRIKLLNQSDVHAAVITVGEVDAGLTGNIGLEGFIYSANNLSTNGDYLIEGSIVASTISNFGGTGTIRFSREKIDPLVVPGLTGRKKVIRNGWKES